MTAKNKSDTSTQSFFLPGNDCCSSYLNIQRKRFLSPVRKHIEQLWKLYAPYADRHFYEDARKHFLERYWEMYLTVTLIRSGFVPKRVGNTGPEFFIEVEARRFWVEAIAPGAGDGIDRVPGFPPGTVFDNPKEQDDGYSVAVFDNPNEQVILRYTNALAEKHAKYLNDIQKGIINQDDGYILAINCRGIPHARFGSVIPYALQAFLSLGPLTVAFDPISSKTTNRYFTKREYVGKSKGTQIPTTAFLDPTYSGISAIIHSAVDAENAPIFIGADFLSYINPLATHPLAIDIFAHWQQYVLRDDQIRLLM